jgi:hypothetical protein
VPAHSGSARLDFDAENTATKNMGDATAVTDQLAENNGDEVSLKHAFEVQVRNSKSMVAAL